MTAWGILGAVSPTLSNWLTPLWLIGAGALSGLVLLLVLWLLAFLVSRLTPFDDPAAGSSAAGESWLLRLVRIPLILLSRRTVREVPDAVREGGLWPVLIVAICLAVFGVVGVCLSRNRWRCSGRWGACRCSERRRWKLGPGFRTRERNDEFSDPVAHEVAVSFRMDEVRQIVFRSDQNLTIASRPFNEVKPGAAIELIAGEEFKWIARQQTVNPFIEQDVERFYVRNLGSSPAKLTSTISTAPPQPEVLDDSGHRAGRGRGVSAVLDSAVCRTSTCRPLRWRRTSPRSPSRCSRSSPFSGRCWWCSSSGSRTTPLGKTSRC